MSSSPTESESTQGFVDSGMEYWTSRWEQNKTYWHLKEVNPQLLKYFDKLIPLLTITEPSNISIKKIFVPMCGKSQDLAYLLSRGLQVFAVEGARQAIEELNQECSFNLIFNESESLYHTQDSRLQIFLGDFYTCPIEKWGPFDFIWDRAAFTAIEYHLRPAYKEIVQRSVQKSKSEYHNFRYLLIVASYDKKLFGGPPRVVDEKDIRDFFADWTNLEILDSVPIRAPHVVKAVAAGGGEPGVLQVYLLTPK